MTAANGDKQEEDRATTPSPEDEGPGDNRGRHAEGPHDIPAAGWKDILWRTYAQVQDDRLLAVAAGVTFYGLLALFPTITALVSIYGLFADPNAITGQIQLLSGFLPNGALNIVAEQMRRIAGQPANHLSIGFAVSLAVALWSANAGTKAIFDGLNVTYGEAEKRSFIRLNLVSLGFTLAGIAFAILILACIVALPIALNFLNPHGGKGLFLRIARWPLLLVALIVALSIIYRFGPNRTRARWRWITPGSALASVLWIAASVAFSWYVGGFGNYNKTYGSLGAIVGFMTWMWISAVIVLMGAELDAEMEHQVERDTTLPPERPLGQRGAKMADTIGKPTS